MRFFCEKDSFSQGECGPVFKRWSMREFAEMRPYPNECCKTKKLSFDSFFNKTKANHTLSHKVFLVKFRE